MDRRMKWVLLAIGALCILGAVWMISPPLLARADAQLQVVGAHSERWSVGTMVEGLPTYLQTAGRFLGTSSVIRSNRGFDKMAYIFPASAEGKTIDGANYYLMSRSGADTGNVLMSLRVYSYEGALQRIVSSADVDLETAVAGAWTAVPLSATPQNLVINPGEFLAYYVEFSGAPGGDLDVRLLFDVAVH